MWRGPFDGTSLAPEGPAALLLEQFTQNRLGWHRETNLLTFTSVIWHSRLIALIVHFLRVAARARQGHGFKVFNFASLCPKVRFPLKVKTKNLPRDIEGY